MNLLSMLVNVYAKNMILPRHLGVYYFWAKSSKNNGQLHNRLNFDLGKKIKIFHHSLKGHFKISKTAPGVFVKCCKMRKIII